MSETPQHQIRLSEEVRYTLDQLQRKLGLTSRSDVIRLAIARLAEKELGKASRKSD